jgi:hypothetical protein
MTDDGLIEKNKEMEYIEKRTLAKKERELDDIKEIAKTVQGRRFLWRILVMAGLFTTAFDPNDRVMCYRSGKRDIGNIIYDSIQMADPSLFHKLQSEYYSEFKSELVQAEKLRAEDNKNNFELVN